MNFSHNLSNHRHLADPLDRVSAVRMAAIRSSRAVSFFARICRVVVGVVMVLSLVIAGLWLLFGWMANSPVLGHVALFVGIGVACFASIVLTIVLRPGSRASLRPGFSGTSNVSNGTKMHTLIEIVGALLETLFEMLGFLHGGKRQR